MNIKLLALDLDGTTINDDHLTISESNLKALRAATDAGVLLVPATGRAFGRVPEIIRELSPRYMINSNGASVRDCSTGKQIYTNPLPFATAGQLFQAFEKLSVYFELYAGGNCYTDRCLEPYFDALPITSQRREMMAQNRVVKDALLDYLEQTQQLIEKFNFPLVPKETVPQLHQILGSVPDLLVTSSMPQNAEVNSATCCKGNALKFLTESLGLTPSQVMAMGDNENDVEMLRYAGIAVVPSNGKACAKTVAGHILDVSNNQDAVAAAIKKWILIN